MLTIFNRTFCQAPSRDRHYPFPIIRLGLAQRIIRLHEGSIDVESKEGEGSTFRVRLPATQG